MWKKTLNVESKEKENNVFDGYNNYSWLSKVNEKLIAENFSNSLEDEEYNWVDVKKIILDIIWEDKISDDDLSDILDELTKEELEKIKENKDLILEIIWKKKFLMFYLSKYWKWRSELTKEELEKIKENKDLILEIIWKKWFLMFYLCKYWKWLSELTREDLERIKENKDLILEITWYEDFTIDYLKEDGKWLGKLTREDLERIKENKDLILEITWKKRFLMFYLSEYWKWLSELTREDLERIKIICSKLDKQNDISTIVWMYKIMKNSNIIKMKNYIERKKNYLENNELIDDSKFKNLFWKREYSEKEEKFVIKKWKYWKWEINQEWLWYCYFYTALELLKKMNFFEVLVRTNLRQSENWNWWYVRLPMWQSDWKWIYIRRKWNKWKVWCSRWRMMN